MDRTTVEINRSLDIAHEQLLKLHRRIEALENKSQRLYRATAYLRETIRDVVESSDYLQLKLESDRTKLVERLLYALGYID